MNIDLIRLAKECPGMQVSITLGELMEAIDITIANVKSELEQTIADEKAETYLSREKVMEMFGVCRGTMHRWQKIGYLVPINMGGKRRYRRSDVKRILEGGMTQKGVCDEV